MDTTTNKTIGLTVPNEYYRKLATLRFAADNKHNRSGSPVTNYNVYRCFRTLMERLDSWLSDEVVRMGYGTEFRGCAFRVIGWQENTGVVIRDLLR